MFNHAIFSNRPTCVEIDLKNLENNIKVIRDIVGNTKILSIVKANAYGHGLVEVSKKLESLDIDYLGVAFIEEAVFLRENGIKTPILVLGAIDNSQIELFLKHDVDITGSSIEKLDCISQIAKELDMVAKVHLKIDTGMGRIGVQWNRVEDYINKAYELPNIEIKGVFSHFADSSDDIDFTEIQLKRFNSVLKYISSTYTLPPLIHIANSGAIAKKLKNTFFNMVRPGILMYGYSKEKVIQSLLKPVMTFQTEVSYFKVLEKDSNVGYCKKYTTKEQTRIITLPVGYADGYPRSLTNKGFIFLRGNKYPVVGRVCMDQLMVDIGKEGEGYVGDYVELWGKNISLFDVSKRSNRSLHDLLSNIGERVPRKYLY
jgi:alanine racemase